MSLFTLQLASASAVALLAGLADSTQGQSVVSSDAALLGESNCSPQLGMSQPIRQCGRRVDDDLASTPIALDLGWTSKRTASDVLTDLLDVDGIRVVADRHLWDRPDTLALRHDFTPEAPFHLYCAAGIDKVEYMDSRVLSPLSALEARHERSVGLMADAGASWRLTSRLSVETDLHWMDVTRDGRLVRTDAGWVGGDPVGLTLSLVWRGR